VRARVEALSPHAVFANEAEEEIVGGPIGDATWIVKLGARGARVGGETWPARPAEVVDTTGAGDAFAAGWLVGGIDLALEAAARCVARLGSMP
jgi:ribokinase